MKYIVYKRFKEKAICGDVNLPALSALSGTNALSVETEVKPSKTTVKGHIK